MERVEYRRTQILQESIVVERGGQTEAHSERGRSGMQREPAVSGSVVREYAQHQEIRSGSSQNAGSKQKFYAVKQGRTPGLYNSWEDCSREVTRYKGAEHKSFSSLSEAVNYLTKP